MHNHGNGKVVNLLKQQAEISKAQVMPGTKTQIKMS